MDRHGQAGFVVLEGLDGTGTTTQAGLLAEALRARDLRVLLTAEPTDGPIGTVLRAHLRGEITLGPQPTALAFTADRADHLDRTIRPALACGSWVVCDRYLLSTLAYQGAEGVDREEILAASAGFEVPDATVFLDPPEAQRAARIGDRDAVDRYESPELAAGLRESYLASIELLRGRGHRIEIVTSDAGPVEVHAEVLRAVDAR